MRFIKTPAQAAAVVDVLREVATASPLARKGKKPGGPVKLANPKLVSAGPGDFLTIDFRHHAQCSCATCAQKNSQPKRRKRNGSR